MTREQTRRHPHVVVGPGDDCAVVRAVSALGEPSAKTLQLVTVDQLVEGRHFERGTPIDRVARKAIARSVSDIAAMGGSPTWALATGVLPPPPPFSAQQAEKLVESLHRWAEHFGCPLVGGDIALHAPSPCPGDTTITATGLEGGGDADLASLTRPPLVLTVTVAGVPHPARGPVLRSTAKIGDLVYVTGRLGGSLGSGRHFSFEPRVKEGLWLAELLGDKLTAMIDLSDGLGRDAGRIGAASGVDVRLELARLPRHPDVSDPMHALADGEDYELCFTASPDARVPDACPHTGTPITRIGQVCAPAADAHTPLAGGSTAVTPDGAVIDASASGWDHTGDYPILTT